MCRKNIPQFQFFLLSKYCHSSNEKGRKYLQCSFTVSCTCSWYLSTQVLQHANRRFSSTRLESGEGGTKVQNEDVKEKKVGELREDEEDRTKKNKNKKKIKSLGPGDWLRAGLTSADPE